MVASISLGALAVIWMIIQWSDVRAAGKAKATVTYMTQIHAILEAENPSDLAPSTLIETLAQYNASPRVLSDGWGHSIQIEAISSSDGNPPAYRLRSLGRDGKQGPCCSGNVPREWETDVVLENGTWRQLWTGFGKATADPSP